MARDVLYTNGVIAVKEKYLLKDKILRLCECGAEDAFRMLSESGFGGGAEVASALGFEELIAVEERALDQFIREYAPSEAEKVYLLSPRDFHNAKALVKAEYLSVDAEKMLAPEGLIPVAEILQCIRTAQFFPLGKFLGGALEEVAGLFETERENLNTKNVSGAEIGSIFEKALSAHLFAECVKKPALKKLLTAKTDMRNILGAMRSQSSDIAENAYIKGGKLSFKQISGIFDENEERAEHALDNTPYAQFYKLCYTAKKEGRPLTQAERLYSSFDTNFFSERRYELEKNEPFLYYVFRRRAEIENVRIVFVCLLAGMSEQDIKARLRVF